MPKEGVFTETAAEYLKDRAKGEGIRVVYDHAPREEGSGTIPSSLGEGPSRGLSLSHIDIAVFHEVGDSRHALVLIEIEESKLTPKRLMGDVFCVLLGESVTWEHKPLLIGNWTTLFIASPQDPAHTERYQHMVEAAESAAKRLGSANAKLGHIEAIELPWEGAPEVELLRHVQAAVDRGLEALRSQGARFSM